MMANKYDEATASSIFFTMLPPEVRDNILTAAFCGRTMHIQRCHCPTSQAKATSSKLTRAQDTARHWLGELFATRKTKGKRVELPRATGHSRRWLGCICNYWSSADEIEQPSPAKDYCLWLLKPAGLEGLRPRSCSNSLDVPPELAIGVMGWLLTSRQAYFEGLKVLYANNIFHIQNSSYTQVWDGFIPQIPETGLSYITSIQFVFKTLPRDMYDDQDRIALLEDELSRIPGLMPSLRKLYVGFLPPVFDRHEVAFQFKRAKYFGGLVENTVRELRRMDRSCELELAIPFSFFMRRCSEANEKHSSIRYATPWREPGVKGKTTYIKDSRNRLFWPIEDQRPDLGSQNGMRGDADFGYWLSESEIDNLGPGLPW